MKSVKESGLMNACDKQMGKTETESRKKKQLRQSAG